MVNCACAGGEIAKPLSEPDRALEICRRAVQAGRDTARLDTAISETLLDKGNDQAALGAWRRAAERSPTAAWAAERLLQPSAIRSDGDVLLAMVESLPAAHVGGTVAHAYRAIALRLRGECDAACAELDLDRLIRCIPFEPPAAFGCSHSLEC